jgi:UDP-glucose 4-epimerase
MSRVLVTGGAGFIGHALLTELLARGDEVVVFDNLSTAEPHWDAPFRPDLAAGRLRFVPGDVVDLDRLVTAVAGVDLVVHLAANTDIAGGFVQPRLDLEGCIVATWNVAEAMRRTGIRRILYASSGVVYGPVGQWPTPERSGPLQPQSHYAAGKLAGEAILCGFAHLYGWRTLAFRFGNTVGARSNHGVVHDFVAKLLRDPSRLEILGDGRQAKPYVAVEDVARGMLLAEQAAPEPRFGVYNVGTEGVVTVDRIAELVIEALGLDPGSVERRYTGSGGGWRGDTERVEFDTGALRGLGWRPELSAEAALRQAALGARERLLAAGPPYLTSFERRALREPSVTTAP